jgi:hypothetical protein
MNDPRSNHALTLRISATLYDKLSLHLGIDAGQYVVARDDVRSESHDVEQAAFLLTEQPTADGTIEVRDLRLITADDFEIQSAFHISLADNKRGELIRWAWETGGCLVEAHSHLGATPACFSASDLGGFADWVPHMWWRLRARPYGALVFANGSFDGLVWRRSPELPEQLEELLIDDGRALEPTRRTLRLTNHRSPKRTKKRRERHDSA